MSELEKALESASQTAPVAEPVKAKRTMPTGPKDPALVVKEVPEGWIKSVDAWRSILNKHGNKIALRFGAAQGGDRAAKKPWDPRFTPVYLDGKRRYNDPWVMSAEAEAMLLNPPAGVATGRTKLTDEQKAARKAEKAAKAAKNMEKPTIVQAVPAKPAVILKPIRK